MEMKVIEKTVKKWLKLKLEYVNIVIAGRIFGGRFGESHQQPDSYFCGADILRINFKPFEILTIFNPGEVTLNQDNDLRINVASEVQFGWYYYGREQISKNWCEEIYLNKKKYVEYIQIFDSKIERKRIINDKEFLIELISYGPLSI